MSLQHATRREYWLRFGTFLEISGKPVAHDSSTVHVREVLPGDVTLNEHEIKDIVSYLKDSLKIFPGDAKYINRIIRHLLPEGTQGGSK